MEYPEGFERTLNSEYDYIRLGWLRQGYESVMVAECEECSASTKGERVIEATCWVCEDCVEDVRETSAQLKADCAAELEIERRMGC